MVDKAIFILILSFLIYSGVFLVLFGILKEEKKKFQEEREKFHLFRLSEIQRIDISRRNKKLCAHCKEFLETSNEHKELRVYERTA
ncbi:MAG: hypothetical protein KDK36_20220 [Leptospiraceae bacterium]|nr:hypothetical protein [Leptospiraceae bacterium]